MADYITTRADIPFRIEAECLICGEPVEVQSFYEITHRAQKVCEKCKAAVMKMRSSMEQEG